MDSEEELEAAYQDKYEQSQILEFIEQEVERRESLSSSSGGSGSITPTPTTPVQIDIKTNAVRYADALSESEDILTALQKIHKECPTAYSGNGNTSTRGQRNGVSEQITARASKQIP